MGDRISRGGGLLTYPVHVLVHVPFAELKKYWEGFQLRRRLQGQKGNNILHGHCVYRSALKILGCFCFSVSGKGEMFFAVITNTPVCRVWQVHASFFKRNKGLTRVRSRLLLPYLYRRVNTCICMLAD